MLPLPRENASALIAPLAPPDGSPEASWYALHIHAKAELSAASALRNKGYAVFLPLYQVRKRWSDRVKTSSLPLFPGYLFCQFDASQRLLPILTTPGVIQIVGAGRSPIAVDDEEIDAIRQVVVSGLRASPWVYLEAGSRVQIVQGPLAGLQGIVLADCENLKLVVSVSLFQRSVAVDIEREWVRPLANLPRQ